MIGDGFLVLVRNFVSNFASLHKFLYQRFDGGCAFCYFLDELEVAGVQLAGLLLGEYARHALDVPQKLALVAGGDGDDVVHGEVAKHAGFYLNLLGVGFPLHFVSSLQFLLSHHA